MVNRGSRESLEKRGSAKFNGKYDYSKFEYCGYWGKSIIICPNHGETLQSPINHLTSDYGCAACVLDMKIPKNVPKQDPKTQEQFELDAERANPGKFLFRKSKYINSQTPVELICSKHEDVSFFLPPRILSASSDKIFCKKCREEIYRFKTIIKCKNKHEERFDYSQAYFKGTVRSKGGKYICNVLCTEHKLYFDQNLNSHLSGKQSTGCAGCGSGYSSKTEHEWFLWNKFPVHFKKKFITLNDKIYYPDAFDEDNKIIYEFYGDYWHSNPLSYYGDTPNEDFNGRSHNENYSRTLSREAELRAAGYTVISTWESDWNWLRRECSLPKWSKFHKSPTSELNI